MKDVIFNGDHGSTLLGVIAAALLSANLDWHAIVGSDRSAALGEAAKACVIAAVALYGFLIGKK